MTDVPFGETLTVLAAPERDQFGDPTESTGSARDIAGCAVWPAGTAEQQNLGDTTATRYDALLPAGEIVKSTDKVQWRGVVYDVDGDPFDYTSPLTGTRAGVLIRLAVVTG